MDREDRTAEASASSGSCDFKSWLSFLSQKGGKNGAQTKQELEVVRGLLEADAAANGHAPLAALLPRVREAYHKDLVGFANRGATQARHLPARHLTKERAGK